MQTILSIPGIHCESCATLIKDVSSEFPSIAKADVDIEKKTVTLEHDASLDFEAWKTEVEGLNDAYEVTRVS